MSSKELNSKAMNPGNECYHLKPESMEELSLDDSLKILMGLQKKLQDRVGKLKEYREADMHEKCAHAIYNMNCISVEFAELLDRLPWKNWKTYDNTTLEGWTDDVQRTETLMEYVDMLHFFLNIPIIFGFSAEEIFHSYLSKNKENHNRQDNGY